MWPSAVSLTGGTRPRFIRGTASQQPQALPTPERVLGQKFLETASHPSQLTQVLWRKEERISQGHSAISQPLTPAWKLALALSAPRSLSDIFHSCQGTQC